ncbi:Piso0_000009 [Millerozyma farinosa CBS 7064]|uniref:Piso0_000009 protein n=1 Tax=Pichia sorbitophila (strain ATCC MYA-4447 / BCRC 22081 / CBS 7064 / NBRC 10061 / NRRL Y-12695) TaxID=559304 RepID=G8YSU9_PICSO|nr:Piso0_000009 [Millerozyma farinosa CBS 7064]
MSYYILKCLGYLLYRVRAGEENLLCNQSFLSEVPRNVKITSDQFADGEQLPFDNTMYGKNLCPSLLIKASEVEGAKSIALLVEDSDVPLPSPAVHLFAFDIDKNGTYFEEGELNKPKEDKYKLGKGTLGFMGFFGPRPPPAHGTHKYTFAAFLLNEAGTKELSAANKPSITELTEVVKKSCLGMGTLLGTYEVK